MKLPAILFTVVALFTCIAGATSNYAYKPDEYVTVVDGTSPNGLYSIAAHGGGEYGYDNFHIYLMDGKTGQKIGPLEEIKNTLDTGADAFSAHWSDDSSQVSITYRIERHVAVSMNYDIANGRAYKDSGPTKVDGLTPPPTTIAAAVTPDAKIPDAPKPQQTGTPKSQPGSGKPGMLKVSDIQQMTAAGLRPQAIIDAIKDSKSVFTDQDIAALKQSDKPISPDVIDYLKHPPAQTSDDSSPAPGTTVKHKKKSSSGGSSLRERTEQFDNL